MAGEIKHLIEQVLFLEKRDATKGGSRYEPEDEFTTVCHLVVAMRPRAGSQRVDPADHRLLTSLNFGKTLMDMSFRLRIGL